MCNSGDIAIIGFSCRFPGAMNVSQFWDNLKKGINSITEIPRERWNIETSYSPNIEDDFKSISKHGGFIEDVDLFDAKYFRIKEERAKLIEPQQRLMLEISAEAINQAGYTRKELSGSQTSVFIGAVQGDYGSSNEYISLDNRIVSDGRLINHRNGVLGNLPNMIPSIVSNYFNLMGPSVIVSTACSSSLVSVHFACQSILSGESKLAIAGGIQLYLSPLIFIGTSKTGALSSDGKCRTFSKDANGYALSEGVGVCLLKRLEDAVNDGDTIYAIIKSSVVNNDGKTVSIIMPNAFAQQKVILQALEKGRIDAASISYFEANGTAMRIGDPLEVKAAASAYRKYTNEIQYCAIGSVEQNIGHAAHAAGVASLIKVILCLLNKQIPPALYCEELNPDIDFPNTPFYPNRELIEWKPRQNCRRAGINAFGFGGTNCHLILEDFDPEKYDKYTVIRKPLPPIKFYKKRYWLNDDKQNILSNDVAKADKTAEEFLLHKLQRDLTKHISEISKEKEKDIDLDGDMGDYNFDSVSFTGLANRINEMCNLEITPAIFFEHPSIDSFARYLCKEYQANLLHHYRDSLDVVDNIVQKEQNRTDTEEIKIRDHFQPLVAQEMKSESRIQIGKEPVAIIGMSGVMPQSEDLETFWKHLEEGEDLITEIPKDRWDWQSYYGDPSKEENKSNVKWGGFINEVDKFDAMFFGISPREAELMDPQQRIFLETVWKTIEDAGYKASGLSGTKTGLFVGVIGIDYFELLKDYAIPIEAHLSTGIAHSILANRISYLLDLHGPSEAIDAACASSLVAVHRAVQAIRSGNCEMAIAGGVNVMIRPTMYIALSKAGMLSEDGRCKTFDKRANGYVRGEGAGAIFLKPLSKAITDGDHICAVIKSTAENHGGRANSLTAPNPNAQAELLITAYEEAKIDPNTVSYIETHGTGTSLGDPIEVNGLKKAFEDLFKRRDKISPKEAYCGIGSVKTNIGHLESAAGIAGVIKVLLSMKYKKMPANINFEELNPYIKLQGSPFYIVNETKPWECLRDDENRPIPRRAGVSSFGFGGANAHIVLEEYEKPVANSSLQNQVPQIIVLSAKNEDRLKAYARRIIAYIEKEMSSEVDNSLADIAYILQIGREAMEERLAVIVSSTKELSEKLIQFCQGKSDIENLYLGNVKRNEAQAVFIEGEEGEEFLRVIVENKKLAKLAQLWVSGVEIDWKLLYQTHTPNRISLPTYPFARDRHWITELHHESIPSFSETIAHQFKPIQDEWMLQFQKAQSELENLGQFLLLNAFHKMDVFLCSGEKYDKSQLKGKLKIIPNYYCLFDALLGILDKAGFVQVKGDEIITTDKLDRKILQNMFKSLEERRSQLVKTFPEVEAHVHLMWICLSAYPEVLSGQKNYTEVIFPNGSMSLVEKIYKGNKLMDYCNSQVGYIIKTYIQRRLQKDPQAQIKILEVGAGTGGTSTIVLRAIKEYEESLHYLYTDVSIAFTEYGRKVYGAEYPFMEFKVLDIEKDSDKQGFDPNSIDIIFASNVLHATKQINNTLNQVKKLLKANGLFILNEITKVQDWITLIFGLTNGWWLFEDEEKRLKDSPLLSPEKWKQLLETSGFLDVHVLGLPDISVIIGEGNGFIGIDETEGKEESHRKEIIIPEIQKSHQHKQSVSEDTTANIHLIINELRKIFSDVLKMHPTHLEEDITIEQYGVDSILILDIFNNVNNKYHLDLKLSDVRQLSTIKQLAEYIYKRFEGKKDVIRLDESEKEQIKNVMMKSVDDNKVNNSQFLYQTKFIKDYKYSFSKCNEYRNFFIQSSQKINIEVITCGKGEPIIFLPPINSVGTAWMYQALKFSKEYKVIVFHYPGYGRSEYSSHYNTFNDTADSILEFIDILNIQKPYHLVGWSLGGLISQLISLKQKQRIKTLTLVNTTSKLEEEDSTDNFYRIINLLIKDFESNLPKSMKSKREGTMDFIKANYSNEFIFHYLEQVLKFDFRDQVSKINLPTLIVTGGKDALTPPRYSEYLHEKIKNSEYHLLKKGGHYIPLQNHKFFNEKLISFIKKRC